MKIAVSVYGHRQINVGVLLESETLYLAHWPTEINAYELNNIYKRTMGRETPIKTVISVATMEATQQKENKHNVASDYQIKH